MYAVVLVRDPGPLAQRRVDRGRDRRRRPRAGRPTARPRLPTSAPVATTAPATARPMPTQVSAGQSAALADRDQPLPHRLGRDQRGGGRRPWSAWRSAPRARSARPAPPRPARSSTPSRPPDQRRQLAAPPQQRHRSDRGHAPSRCARTRSPAPGRPRTRSAAPTRRRRAPRWRGRTTVANGGAGRHAGDPRSARLGPEWAVLALVEEAMRKAAVAWLDVPGHRPYPCGASGSTGRSTW